jgi:hypothetical protein
MNSSPDLRAGTQLRALRFPMLELFSQAGVSHATPDRIIVQASDCFCHSASTSG